MPFHSRPTVKTLGVVLRDLRKNTTLSQDKLANLAAVGRSYLGAVERGERQPTWETVERILAAIGVGWEEFGRAIDAEVAQENPLP